MPPVSWSPKTRGLRRTGWLAALLALACGGVAETAPERVSLATGPKDGMYYRLAQSIQEQLRREGIEIEIQPNPDCVENPSQVAEGGTRFAFAQQDVVSEYVRENPRSNLRVVDGVFFDYLHIFVREPLRVDSAMDFRSLRIWAGERGSGTRLAASRFLNSLGLNLDDRLLTFEELEERERSDPWIMERAVDRLPDWFEEGRLDVAMLVETPGTRSLCDLVNRGKCSLLPLDRGTLRRLTSRRQLLIQPIPAGTYASQKDPIETIAVPVLLLAREGENPETAGKVLAEAIRGWKHLARASQDGCRLSLDAQSAGLFIDPRIKRLPGVDRPRQLVPPESLWWGAGAVSLLVFLGLAVRHRALVAARGKRLWRRLRKARREAWLHHRILCWSGAVILTGILSITFAVWHVERKVNDHFSTPWESFWSITVHLFSGLEDRVPYTAWGKLFVGMGMAIGALSSVFASALLTSFFIRKEVRMPHNLKDHYLLLNWNERAAEVVKELHHEIVRERQGVSVVVVLTDDPEDMKRVKEAGSGRDEAFEDFYISIGDPTDERALLNANAQDAHCVLVLADEKHGDERTICSIFKLRKIARANGRTDLHVVAELANAANDSILEEMAQDFPGTLERVSGLKIRTCLLSQAALNRGIVSFYTDLLRVSGDTNEVYKLPVPASAAGMKFREYAALVLQRDGDEPLIPVGIERTLAGRSRVITNPKDGEAVLQPGDHLLLIAYGQPAKDALPEPQAPAARSPFPPAGLDGKAQIQEESPASVEIEN